VVVVVDNALLQDQVQVMVIQVVVEAAVLACLV
jgi:hypothetical protein